MHAMVLHKPGSALEWSECPTPKPRGHEVLIEVEACAICRTDLHLLDAELPDIEYPIIPGHQVIGRVVDAGPDAVVRVGTRVGVAWLGQTCRCCEYCRGGNENLCDAARFHGYHLNGGYAEYMVADSRYVFSLNRTAVATDVAPLLCGGLIGYRSLQLAGAGQKLGIYGFGSAAHLITQVAVSQGRDVYAFVRPGDTAAAQFARECGACWAGASDGPAPVPLDAAIIFAPAGALVPKALGNVRKGGRVVCGGIHMSDIPAFPYSAIWGERTLTSVANMTRDDGHAFLAIATEIGIKAHTHTWALQDANIALEKLRRADLVGTAVLLPDRRS